MHDATPDHRPIAPSSRVGDVVADPGIRMADQGPRMEPLRWSEDVAAAGGPDVPSPELVQLLTQLRSSVARYVRGRRAAGVTVERVLPEVRSLVCEAERREDWPHLTGAVLAEVVRWSVAAYHAR